MPTCRRRPMALPRRHRARALAGLSTMCNRIRQGGAQKGSLLTISVRGRAGHIDGSSDRSHHHAADFPPCLARPRRPTLEPLTVPRRPA